MKCFLILFSMGLPFWLPAQTPKQQLPQKLTGKFVDDYHIEYQISDTVWLQKPNISYHILKVDTVQKFIILRNDSANRFDANRYTRIDYTYFDGMAPYFWGFCLTNYRAKTRRAAEKTASADRQNPKKGCNGYPFSRMRLLLTR